MSNLRQRRDAYNHPLVASFSVGRLARPWDDVDPNELPPIVGQALRDLDTRQRFGLSLRHRYLPLVEAMA